MREKEEKTRQGDERGRVTELYLEHFDLSCTVEPRNNTVVRGHFGHADQGPEMDS